MKLTKIDPLTPKDRCSGRTAPLTSKRWIIYIYSTNTGTEYFKHGIYCLFFSLQNAVYFIILNYLVRTGYLNNTVCASSLKVNIATTVRSAHTVFMCFVFI